MAPLHCETTSYDFDELYLQDIDAATHAKPTKKSVRFTYCVQVCDLPPISEMTKREYRSTFYTAKDYRHIQRENRETLNQMTFQQKVDVENDSLYFRGLEVHLPNAIEERQRRRRFVISEVLREQEVHGRIRSGWVENFSSRFTAHNAAAALRRGLWDMRASTASDSSSQ